jgi:hypothetical protein
MRRLGRRLITIPCYVILFAVTVSTLPLTLPVATTVDVAKRIPWGVTRSLLFFTWYLMCKVVGIVLSTGAWLVGGIVSRGRRERYLRWHFKLEYLWAYWLLSGREEQFGEARL